MMTLFCAGKYFSNIILNKISVSCIFTFSLKWPKNKIIKNREKCICYITDLKKNEDV